MGARGGPGFKNCVVLAGFLFYDCLAVPLLAMINQLFPAGRDGCNLDTGAGQIAAMGWRTTEAPLLSAYRQHFAGCQGTQHVCRRRVACQLVRYRHHLGRIYSRQQGLLFCFGWKQH